MKTLLMATLAAAVMIPGAAEAKKKDSPKKEPVVVTVNGHDVPVSEFEYLYNKNNSQQVAPQTLDEYLDMFVVYKLKVADAEACGIDTTAQFRREYAQYVNELATPYLRDEALADSLLRVAYDRKKTERKFSYIQLPGGGANIERLDSIRTAIINGADFAAMAAEYSVDPNAKRTGGELGWISYGMIPAEIEDQVYDTPLGGYSPVFDTRYGTLFVHPTQERANRGERQVRHILKLTQGKDEQGKAVARARIDSLLTVVRSGADFAEVAKAESDDPGSAAQGGLIQWFGAGRMVPEFEETSFKLRPGEISDVVETAYGYHIILGEGERGVGSFEEERVALENAMKRSGVAKRPVKRVLDRMRSKFPVEISESTRKYVNQLVSEAGGLDSIVLRTMAADLRDAATVGDKAVTLKDVSFALVPIPARTPEAAMSAYEYVLNELIDRKMMDNAVEDLPSHNTDFRNLINEYRDGILLYEISNKNVWNRANTDAEGLQEYFLRNREKYNWSEPRYKGYVMLASSDSVADIAKEIVNDFPDLSIDDLKKMLRQRLKNEVRMEKVLAKKGDNAVVDYAAFNGPLPESRSKWNEFFIFRGKYIDQPEEATDVKGAVSSDWQQELEKEWVDSLRKKYPVKVNDKVVKSLR